MRICSINGCKTKFYAHGLCFKHYMRQRRNGTTELLTASERFFSKVDKSNGPCWVWLAGKNKHGYGVFGMNGKTTHAHRASWEIANGPIPDGDGYHGTCVLHHCDNRQCVNPSHLFLGSQAANVADMYAKNRQACRKGEKNGLSKLTEAAVIMIRKKYAAEGVSQQELANDFNVDQSMISLIVSRKNWGHI